MLRVLLVVVLAVVIVGCGASQEAPRQQSRATDLEKFISEHERNFNPSEFNSFLPLPSLRDSAQDSVSTLPPPTEIAQPETTAGFRVQVLMTQDIDEATKVKNEVGVLIPEEWVYMIYESPYYKVRVGNFLDRSGASTIVPRLSSAGFRDAWIVPDKVFTNMPAIVKPPDASPETED